MLRVQKGTFKVIAKKIGVHECILYQLLSKYDQGGVATLTQRPGRNSNITDRDTLNIVLIIKLSQKISMEHLREEVGSANISLATLFRGRKFCTVCRSRLCPRKHQDQGKTA